jgi:hypothetical protein
MESIASLYQNRYCGLTIDDFDVTIIKETGDSMIMVDADVYGSSMTWWTLSEFLMEGEPDAKERSF